MIKPRTPLEGDADLDLTIGFLNKPSFILMFFDETVKLGRKYSTNNLWEHIIWHHLLFQ